MPIDIEALRNKRCQYTSQVPSTAPEDGDPYGVIRGGYTDILDNLILIIERGDNQHLIERFVSRARLVPGLGPME